MTRQPFSPHAWLRAKRRAHLAGMLLPVMLQGAALAAETPANTPFLADWSLSGQNTLKLEYYGNSGDENASPYLFDGDQWYNDFSGTFHRRVSAYEQVRGNFAGTLNQSDYRSREEGLYLERGTVFWEKGDGSVPFRSELGDFFGYQSFRTIQRSLKGLQVELQPRLGSASGYQHSVQLFSGITNPFYRDLGEDDDIFSGLSWLMQTPRYGVFSLNGVHNYREAQFGADVPTQKQFVASLAWFKDLKLATEQLELEAEYGRFDGDLIGRGGFQEDKDGNGYYAQLSGRSERRPLTYRLRFEQYGQNYRPNAAPIVSDQRKVEAHSAWTFRGGLQLRGRLQHFRDALDSDNPRDTNVGGITLSGPVLAKLRPGTTGYLNAFVQDRDDDDGSINALTRSINLSLTTPLGAHLSGRAGFLWTGTDDKVTNINAINRQYNLAVDWDFVMGRFNGTLSPGLFLRHNTARDRDQDEINPTIALSLSGGPHRLQLSHNALAQDAKFRDGTDVLSNRSSLVYAFTKGRHRLGIEADYFHRNPDPGRSTGAYRVAGFWTVSFNRPAPRIRPTRMAMAATPEGGLAAPPQMAELAPGITLETAKRRLAESGFVSYTDRRGLWIYEARLLDSIDRRQRLGLLNDGMQVTRSVLVIEFDRVGDQQGMLQTFERVREVLINRYGTPELRIEEGAFGPAFEERLAIGRFKRIMEWRTSAGWLRFGIPNRTDGQIRMEIQHAPGFPPGESNNWSVERLR